MHSRGYSRSWNTGFAVEAAEGVEALYIFFDPKPLLLSATPAEFARDPRVTAITSDRNKLDEHRKPMFLS